MKKSMFIKGLKEVLVEKGFSSIEEILDEKEGMGLFVEGDWLFNSSDCMLEEDLIIELEEVICEYCESVGVEVVI